MKMLYNQVSEYSPDPLSEIDSLALKALSEGKMSQREYLILQDRMPLYGHDILSGREVGEKLGVSAGRVQHLEVVVYRHLHDIMEKRD